MKKKSEVSLSLIKLFYKSADGVDDVLPDGISEYRKNKILRAKNADARRTLIAAAEVLKAGFASFGINEERVAYAFLENGKPYAPSYPEIHFSLSHSENIAVAAFSDRPVGVDCERAERHVSEALIERFLSEDEARRYKDEPLLLWVAAESVSKLSGDGIFGDKRTPVPSFCGDTAEGEGFVLRRMSLCGNIAVLASETYDTVELLSL